MIATSLLAVVVAAAPTPTAPHPVQLTLTYPTSLHFEVMGSNNGVVNCSGGSSGIAQHQTCFVYHTPAKAYFKECNVWVWSMGVEPKVTVEKGACKARITSFKRDSGNDTLWHVGVEIQP